MRVSTTASVNHTAPAASIRRILARVLLGFAVLATALFVPALWAHHSMSAVYDSNQPVRLDGVVTRYEWANPHVWIFVDIESRGGRVENWAVEWASRIELRRNGWTGDSIHPGDHVLIEASRARELPNRAGGKFLTLDDGTNLVDPSVDAPADLSRESHPERATPRWPDGHPRLGPAPGEAGYWANPSVASLYEDTGTPIAMNSEGLLADLNDAPKVAPFQPWALGLYRYRQQTLLKDDPMAACLPPAGPRQFQAPYGLQFLEQPERQRLFVLSRGGNRNWRLVPLDGRELVQPEDVTPAFFGYSTGRWEDDTLVINSAGFVERYWFSNGGLPHTEALRLTERISRPDYYTLNYEVTVDDPRTYTRPWTARWTLEWIPRDDVDEYFCDDYNRELEHVN